MALKCFVKQKLKDLRYNYGQPAVDHFEKNPICNRCGEDRLGGLNIHHVHGKNYDVFETLCFTCHMLEHRPEIAHITYAIYLEKLSKRKNKVNEKIENIKLLLKKGVSLRNIVFECKTSLEFVQKILKKEGYETMPRIGYRKIIED